MHVLKTSLIAFLYALSTLVFSLVLSWGILGSQNFLYGVWHDYGGLKEGIEKYGPQNRYKKSFADTSREQRVRAFTDIVIAIHSSGSGLKDITYVTQNEEKYTLLHDSEVTHLQDVSNLIDTLWWPAIFVCFMWLLLSIGICTHKVKMPNFLSQIGGLAGGIFIGLILVFIIGPERVFNWAHETVFPENHQWFFYYQESLMSTMMMAPKIFAYIAVTWGIFAVCVFVLCQYLIRKIATRRS